MPPVIVASIYEKSQFVTKSFSRLGEFLQKQQLIPELIEPALSEDDKKQLKENLAEQAQQARTMFFAYISTLVFLVITLISVTDKAIFLDNTLVKLPLVGIDVPLKPLFYVAPCLLVVMYKNFHILYNRYVVKAFAKGLSKREREQLFPFALFQGVFNPTTGILGILEAFISKIFVFALLSPSLLLYLFYGAKFQDRFIDTFLLAMLFLGLVLERISIRETYRCFLKRNRFTTLWDAAGFLLVLIIMILFVFIAPYTINATPLKAFPAYDDLQWIVIGLVLFIASHLNLIVQLNVNAKTQVASFLIVLMPIMVFIGFNRYFVFQNWVSQQKRLLQKKSIELSYDENESLKLYQLLRRNKQGLQNNPSKLLQTGRMLVKVIYQQDAQWLDGFLLLKMQSNDILSKKPEALNDIQVELAQLKERDKKILINSQIRTSEQITREVPWLTFDGRSLNRIKLNRAIIPFASFENAHLKYSFFTETVLTGGHFNNAKLEWSNLSKAYLNKTDLTNTDLQHAHLARAHLEQAKMDNTDFRKANFCLMEPSLLVRT